jgi:F-type H+-transporting ATPase subunit epsilon
MQTRKTFTVTIARVNEQLFNGLAYSITVPGSEGELTILADHEPLVSLLKTGTITVRKDEATEKFQIEKGLLETSNGQVTVLL